ncbi:hypothetical protein EJ06DRAFT_255790 [Trichodelitschia bisporula]|uniref:Uncharacterized protein n=1 Tax=Trichodelitschia bisporula TaxID=703511 RepID=A0A6G1HJ06_9PEZI|nr:hypothetical protein EJ06DRAFT_255790 [Trichodelitschia bisporula]
MKSLLLTLPLAHAAVVTHLLQPRQFDLFGLQAGMAGPVKPAILKTKSTPLIDSGAVREKLLWGPFPLQPANGSHPAGTTLKLDPASDVISTKISGLCTDCMVLFAKADLATKTGEKADIGQGVYSHHVIITDIGHPMVMMPVTVRCPGGGMGGFNFGGMMAGSKGGDAAAKGGSGMAGMSHGGHAPVVQRRQASDSPLSGLLGALGKLGSTLSTLAPPISVFVGQGDEGSGLTFQTKGSTLKSGFYLSAKDQLNMMAEVINYKNVGQDVYITLEYEYIPNLPTRPKEYLDVGMGAINVDPCGKVALHPPADKPVKYTSLPWDVVGDGYLLDIRPHLHDGGVNMTFSVNGKVACSSQAVYGGTDGGAVINGEKWETITAYTPCGDHVAIKKGDKLTMEAWYDLTAHRLRPQSTDHAESAEGMALANFIYAKQVA